MARCPFHQCRIFLTHFPLPLVECVKADTCFRVFRGLSVWATVCLGAYMYMFVCVCECHIDDGCKLTHTNFVVHWENYQICSMRIYLSRGVNRRPLLGIECQSVVNEMLGMTRRRAWSRSLRLKVLPARKCGNEILRALAELKKLKFNGNSDWMNLNEPEIL